MLNTVNQNILLAKSWLFFKILIFWVSFSGIISVVVSRAPDGMGPRNRTKKLILWMYLLGEGLPRFVLMNRQLQLAIILYPVLQ